MASVAYHTESFLANHSRFVRLGSPLNISRPDAQVSLYPNVYKEKGSQARVLVVPKALACGTPPHHCDPPTPAGGGYGPYLTHWVKTNYKWPF